MRVFPEPVGPRNRRFAIGRPAGAFGRPVNPRRKRQDRQYGHGTGQRRVRCQNAQVKRF